MRRDLKTAVFDGGSYAFPPYIAAVLCEDNEFREWDDAIIFLAIEEVRAALRVRCKVSKEVVEVVEVT